MTCESCDQFSSPITGSCISNVSYQQRDGLGVNSSSLNHRRAAVRTGLLVALAIVALVSVAIAWRFINKPNNEVFSRSDTTESSSSTKSMLDFLPRFELDAVGFVSVGRAIEPWRPDASLDEIAKVWDRIGYRTVERIDRQLADKKSLTEMDRYSALYTKAGLLNYEGEAKQAYDLLAQARMIIESKDETKRDMLYNLIFLQGVTALRRGENENCILCRGESSCILPINEAARHIHPEGSRLAIQHFTEYLEQFPDDFEIQWLLNLAHMTLGEHPEKVDPRFVIIAIPSSTLVASATSAIWLESIV